MDIKKLAQKYNKSKAYKDGSKTPFYKELVKHLELQIDLRVKQVIMPGFETEKEEKEALMEARAYKRLLMYMEGQINNFEKLKEQVKE